MKKSFIKGIICIIGAVTAFACSGITACGYTVADGDINMDSVTDATDLAMLSDFLNEKQPLDLVGLTVADLNGDGIVTDIDYNLLKKYTTGDFAESKLLNRSTDTGYGYYIDDNGNFRYTVDLLGNRYIGVNVKGLSKCYLRFDNSNVSFDRLCFYSTQLEAMQNNSRGFSIIGNSQDVKAIGTLSINEIPQQNNIYTVDVPQGAETMCISLSKESPNQNSAEVGIYNNILEAGSKSFTDQAPVSPLNEKNWCVMGDSVTNSPSSTLAQDGKSYNYHTYIQQETNCNITNLGVAGSGYSYIYVNKDKSYKPVYTLVDSIPKDTDLITIFMGTNDYGISNIPLGSPTDTLADEENYLYGGNTICGFINRYLDEIQEKFPYTPVGVISPIPRSNRLGVTKKHLLYSEEEKNWITDEAVDGWQFGEVHYNNFSMEQLVSAIKQICENRGVPYLDMYNGCLLKPSNNVYNQLYFKPYGANVADGLHPNAFGHQILYPKIKAFAEALYAD